LLKYTKSTCDEIGAPYVLPSRRESSTVEGQTSAPFHSLSFWIKPSSGASAPTVASSGMLRDQPRKASGGAPPATVVWILVCISPQGTSVCWARKPCWAPAVSSK
jgi:hypothetical protein